MRLPARPLSGVIAGVVAAIAGFTPAPAAADLVEAEKRAREYAAPRVFAVVGDKGRGTAVLLKVSPDGRTGYFATCYHVLHRSTTFHIYPSDGMGKTVAVSTAAKVLTRRSLDLVLIKADLAPGVNVKPLDPLDPNGMVPEDDKSPVHGFVFGMAGFQSRQLFPSGVRIQQTEYADLLKIIDFTELRPGDARLRLRFLGKEMTYAGMSGGLVVDADRRFAGLLLGRMPEPNAIPVMVVAAHVKELLDEAEQPAAAWAAVQPTAFADPPPYKKAVLQRMAEPWPVSEISWDGYDAWVKAFESDPRQFLEAFQEVRLDLADLRAVAADTRNRAADRVRLRVHGDGQVRLLLNGVPWAANTPAALQPGENLLVVSRPPAGDDRLDLTDLLRPNPVDVTLELGDPAEPVFQLKRSLPRVIRGYSVYVTIRNGLPDPTRGYAARLAVPLDYLEEVINHTPFVLPFGTKDPRTGSEVDGFARPTGDRPVKLTYVSPQTLDVTTRIGLKVKTAQANFAGLRVAAKAQDATIDMTGRLQFPASPRAPFFVCARAIAAAGGENQFVLPVLGDQLTVDASSLVRELLVCYTNTRLLHPNDPKTPGPDDIREFLGSSGLVSAAGDWRLAPAALRLVEDDRPGRAARAWAVVTFRLLHKGVAVEAKTSPPLLPDPAARDALACEFVWAGVPAPGMAALHPTLRGAAGVPDGFGAAGSDPLAVKLRVPRPKLDKRAEVKLTGNAAGLSAEVGKVVTEGLAQTPVTGEVWWAGWKAADGNGASGVVLTAAFTPGAAAPAVVTGDIAVDRAEVKSPTHQFILANVRGKFRLTVDPKDDTRAFRFNITTTAGRYTSGKEPERDLPVFDFDVWVSRNGKTVSNNFATRFAFRRGAAVLSGRTVETQFGLR